MLGAVELATLCIDMALDGSTHMQNPLKLKGNQMVTDQSNIKCKQLVPRTLDVTRAPTAAQHGLTRWAQRMWLNKLQLNRIISTNMYQAPYTRYNYN